MATYEIDIPGKGRFRVDSPSELTDSQAYKAALSQSDAVNPTDGMSGFQRGAAAAGGVVSDLWLGAKQAVAPTIDLLLPGTRNISAELEKEAADKRAIDSPLLATTGGKVGNFVGNAVAGVPTMFVPGANTYRGAALVSGLLGALQPTVDGESRLGNAGLFAAGGVAGQGVANSVGRLLRPVQNNLSPVEQNLANQAQQRGIPLTAGDLTGSRALKTTESVLESLPLTAGPQLAQKQAQKEAFNRAVGGTFGSPEAAITPDVVGAARNRIGGEFTALAGRNTLQADEALMSGLARIDADARRYLTPDVGGVVINRIDDVMARIENGTMSGVAYRNLDSELGRASRNASNGDLRNALGDLRGTLREAMDRSISTADQAAWGNARRQYANLMTVAPLAARSEVGDVSGRTLLQAANTANRNARFGGPSELAELGRIGRAFVADNIPNSGTAQRLAIQGLLTGGGALAGGVGSAASGGDWSTGALVGGGAMVGGLLSPRAIQAAMNSGPGQAYLSRGIHELTDAQRRALSYMMRGAGSGLLGYAGQQ